MKIIAALLLFYPLIIPVWEKGPLNGENTMNPDARTFLTKSEVETQMELLTEIDDPSIRSAMVFELVRSNNPAAIPLLTRLLDSERDPLVKTDVLKALYNMRSIRLCDDKRTLERFSRSERPAMRAYSAALMVANSHDVDRVAERLKTESSAFVVNLAFEEMLRKPDAPSESILLELSRSDNPAAVAGAVAVLAARSKNPDDIPELAKFARDKRLPVRAALAKSLANRESGGSRLLALLARDANSSIRSCAASSIPTVERLPLYLELIKDSDWEVRRLAAKSLGGVNDPKSIAALREAIADVSAPVRKAAGKSLIALAPSEKILNGIVARELAENASRATAITVLGTLKFAPAAAAILGILEKSNDDDIVLRSVKALWRLKYAKASLAVAKRADSPNPAVRTAVAEALGVFADKRTFDTLLKLSDDKRAAVAAEAIKAMGVTKSSFFNSRLLRALKQVQASPDIRANACWSVPKTGAAASAILAQLKRLALEQVIPAMGMREYDADYVRISAVLAMIDLGAGSPKAREQAKLTLAALKEKPVGEFATQIAGDTLKEFARQAELYMNGVRNIPKTEFPTTKPSLTATRMK